ncbi:MAG: redox-regulated ATPase YchF [Planctomycetes bacterium]|nr:redox-regulated ATPase YchF [Planctomycetota bacterium]
MRAAIIGPPQSGKSTLFYAVTNLMPDPGQMPQEHVATVAVPDTRIPHLVELCQPKKTTFANVEFLDVPGVSLADAHGRADFAKYLPSIRNCDVLVIVVRDFKNTSVPEYRNRIDCHGDLADMHEELIFADLDVVTTRLEKLEKSLKKPTKTHEQEKKEMVVLQRCAEALEASKPLSTAIASDEDAKLIASFSFATQKPAVAVYNVDDDRAAEPIKNVPENFHSAIPLCADIEAQINELPTEDRAAFLGDIGVEEPARDRLIRTCYDAMNLMSFLTMGPDEVRAWTIPKGTLAVDAAGKIHSDLARGFIRAETVSFADLMETGNFKSAKAAGKVRQEGKTYEVQDGDILNIKFNV